MNEGFGEIMINFDKVELMEIDKDDTPFQAWFNYNISDNEIRELVEDCENNDNTEFNIDSDGLECSLCLTMYSREDFKLEAFVTDENGEQEWFVINRCIIFGKDYTDKIPNYNELMEEYYLLAATVNELDINSCYTYNDFLELTGSEDEAENLFDMVDWQHPSSLWDELDTDD